MLSVWWDVHGIIMMELLPSNTNVTAAYYCVQLQRLSFETERKRPRHEKIRLLHDNDRPRMATMTCQKVLDIGWEVLPHPAFRRTWHLRIFIYYERCKTSLQRKSTSIETI